MPSCRKRPCCICHCWFSPDNRVGDRQQTCGRPDCQRQRRRKMQATWRALNPDYFNARRIQARMPVAALPASPTQPGRSSSSAPPAPSAQPGRSTSPLPPASSRSSASSSSPAWPPSPLRLPPPLNQLPWDIAQSAYGPQGADFIAIMGGLLLRETQFKIAVDRVDSTADGATLRPPSAQSQIPAAAYLGGSGSEAVSHAAGISPT